MQYTTERLLFAAWGRRLCRDDAHELRKLYYPATTLLWWMMVLYGCSDSPVLYCQEWMPEFTDFELSQVDRVMEQVHGTLTHAVLVRRWDARRSVRRRRWPVIARETLGRSDQAGIERCRRAALRGYASLGELRAQVMAELDGGA